jgi:hypothetical protein
VPAGFVLVHNQVRPVQRIMGMNGSRYWLLRTDNPELKVEVCDCGFAPELGRHYRVVRTSD